MLGLNLSYKIFSGIDVVPENIGRVLSVSRNSILLATASGELTISNSKKMINGMLPVVGDWCVINSDRTTVSKILCRKNVVSRKVSGTQFREQIISANIDLICVCISMREKIRASVISRFLFGLSGDFRQLLLLTQSDLSKDSISEMARIRVEFPNVKVFEVCALRDDLSFFKQYLEIGETMALIGPSGVGKSTIINSLLGYDKQSTSFFSKKTNKGRHTTTATTLHYASNIQAWIIDTPGIRELGLWNVENEPETFRNMYELAKECRFSNCSHMREPGCKIKSALETGIITKSQYVEFLKLERERQTIKFIKRKHNKK